MKDLILIDNSLLVYFWAKPMDTSNYHYNQLPTRPGGLVFILEKAWTSVRQNLEYIWILESRLNTIIFNENVQSRIYGRLGRES